MSYRSLAPGVPRGDYATSIVGKVVGTIPIVGNIASGLLSLFGGSMFDDPTPQIRAWQAAMARQYAVTRKYSSPRSQRRDYLRAMRAIARRR